MPSLQQIQSRRKAVKNVGQITKAMEVVAATKMRKSQETALKSRPYAYKVLELLDRMLTFGPVESRLLKANPGPELLVIVTSDRGLIGSFNSQVLRTVDGLISENQMVITVGRKATAYANKKKLNVIKSYEGFGEFVLPQEIDPLTDFLVTGYKEEQWSKVSIVATFFRTTLKQEVMTREILPLDLEKVRETVRQIIPEHGRYSELSGATAQSGSAVAPLELQDQDTYIFEPSAEEAMRALMPHLLRMEIYDILLEANASEHSARMVAMKTASDNASELSGTLTLEYNKARQAGITREIIEITSTQNALT